MRAKKEEEEGGKKGKTSYRNKILGRGNSAWFS